MRILLVEDDRRIARFVAKGLREQAYAVDVIGNGDEVGYKLSINDYDAVVLDVMIPGRDGFQVCRDLRASNIAVPVIMLTARDTVQDRITGLDSGADDYLTKPFAVTELLARLRALLRRGRIVRPATIGVADLMLDTSAQTATRQGKTLALTTKEYALLEYLAPQPVDMHVDKISKRVEIFVPNMFGNFGAANNSACFTRQVLKQCIFFEIGRAHV